MSYAEFIAKCLCLDLESRGDIIYRIGAVYKDAQLERKGRFRVDDALLQLDEFGEESQYILGHNLIDHDVPLLFRTQPRLGLLKKPVVDTLFLSPLAFPENPYHRLVKDYKLVRESLNDPVADARLAASVFRDQWQSFAAMMSSGREDVLALYRQCFAAWKDLGAYMPHVGLSAVFQALGGPEVSIQDVTDEKLSVDLTPRSIDLPVPAPYSSTAKGMPGSHELSQLVFRVVGDRACGKALQDLFSPGFSEVQDGPAIAYCVAWLLVSGSNSVMPPWVRRRFPKVTEIISSLRDIPCNDPSCSYCRTTHDPNSQLKRYFGFPEFRGGAASSENRPGMQEAIVQCGMSDKPLLAILPTGGGKSLCYQLPALVRHFRRGSLTIVITPLQALMKDQVDNLTLRTGAPSAAALYGLLTPPERGEVLERVRLGDVAILYIAPEQLRNKSFRGTIAQREIGCWVFDEAHCLSKWGHDFRPDYLYAGRFIREFADEQKTAIPPVACYTATAKLDVRTEIVDYFRRELHKELQVFEGSVERANLRFQVQLVKRAEKQTRIHEVLSERLTEKAGSALIYTATRQGAQDAAAYLQMKGWPAAAFHAGLSVPEKRAVLEGFVQGEIRVICATNAFGMGIDKDDVRLVLHSEIPGSLENYLQEAGRAGRDMADAECLLLYDEQDVETQFKLEAMSELNQRDISQIMRGLRRARRSPTGELVITAGELLRDDEVDTSFDMEDRQADTKVKTGIAWLERAGFIERNQNNTRVFQGRPMVKDLDEARIRIGKLNLSKSAEERWLSVLQALINMDVDEGISADEIAELPAFKVTGPTGSGAGNRAQSDTEQVMRTLYDMAERGLIERGLLLTAYVRHKVKDHSQIRFERACALETDMFNLMRESAPDAASEGWLDLSLRKLNQRLVDKGHADSNPQVLLGLLKSLSMDGRGFAGNRGSIELRQAYQDHYRVKLQRDWEVLIATANKRRQVAEVVLDTITAKIPSDAPPAADLLVSFSMDDITLALRTNIYLAGQVKDPLAAIDRGLMFLHEQKAIILQQGLAVFRQAMTIRILSQPRDRKYSKQDYEPLLHHYRERILQVHVMNEYARLGLEKIRQALELVLAYFSLDKTTFLKRFFPGRKEIIERATSQESYKYIVEELGNKEQIHIVSSPEEANLLVLAGPGSGKTRVVAHRCAYLLRVKRVPAHALLVLCFNRNAAVTLRRRLEELVGPDARGIMVQTYHGLAMRLTGISFADLTEKERGERVKFDHLIPETLRLLRGEKEILGVEADEMRDRLLSGYRHILVDEYQDIDQDQYDLISAIAGRREREQDRKLNILAVGDDDQNIYTFRGANVEFIRRFERDYRAGSHHLVENYRSSAHIISACNSLISHNQDRMKTMAAIRVNCARKGEPPGGEWEERDPVGRGKVQVIEVADDGHQAMALVAEIKRMQSLKNGIPWSEFAVLARTREALAPVRAVCEQQDIPVVWGLSRVKTPALSRIREIHEFLDSLKTHLNEITDAAVILDRLDKTGSARWSSDNPWWLLLREIVENWSQETSNSQLPIGNAVEFIYESLAEQRRDHCFGKGIFLGTVHSTKGMEFSHVFMPDGGWTVPRSPSEMEEERRIFYVGMTRARNTLCLFLRNDRRNPHVKLIEGEFLMRRIGDRLEDMPPRIINLRYELLGMEDLFLDFAGRQPPQAPLHRHLAALRPGSELAAGKKRNRIELRDKDNCPVAALSQNATRAWLPHLEQIQRVRVLGMVRRECSDSGEQYGQRCCCESWEVPWVEIVSSNIM